MPKATHIHHVELRKFTTAFRQQAKEAGKRARPEWPGALTILENAARRCLGAGDLIEIRTLTLELKKDALTLATGQERGEALFASDLLAEMAKYGNKRRAA